LIFLNAPMMRCCYCHFPRGSGEYILRKQYLLEMYLLNFLRYSLIRDGSVADILIPIGPLLQLQYLWVKLLKDYLRAAEKLRIFFC
jgi:hypothetical protein